MSEKKRVLMVDDETRFRETTSRLLTKKGFETTIAASGEEALRILKQSPQDVVILDVKMEGMDGHTALSEIKKIAPDTQVIMLTGHGSPDSAKSSRQRDAFDYLTKPCDIDLLTMKINEAVAAKRRGVSRGAEKKARDIMLSIADYTTVSVDTTVREAVRKLMASFQPAVSSSRIMDAGHRSLLIFNQQDKLVGILSTMDLIKGVRPAYLSPQRPDMSASIQFSSLFWGGWDGLFSIQMEVLAEKTVGELMSDPPPTITGDTNLIQVADLMYKTRKRRLIVTEGEKVIGIVRERDLFFEMARIVLQEKDPSSSNPSN
jgi:CheY-like chemotaxis protein